LTKIQKFYHPNWYPEAKIVEGLKFYKLKQKTIATWIKKLISAMLFLKKIVSINKSWYLNTFKELSTFKTNPKKYKKMLTWGSIKRPDIDAKPDCEMKMKNTFALLVIPIFKKLLWSTEMCLRGKTYDKKRNGSINPDAESWTSWTGQIYTGDKMAAKL
jgi:hypothetical protein